MTDPEPVFWAMHELIRSVPLRYKPRAGLVVELEPGKLTWRVVRVDPKRRPVVLAAGLESEGAAEAMARSLF